MKRPTNKLLALGKTKTQYPCTAGRDKPHTLWPWARCGPTVAISVHPTVDSAALNSTQGLATGGICPVEVEKYAIFGIYGRVFLLKKKQTTFSTKHQKQKLDVAPGR